MASKNCLDKKNLFYRAKMLYKKMAFPAPQAPHSVGEIPTGMFFVCSLLSYVLSVLMLPRADF